MYIDGEGYKTEYDLERIYIVEFVNSKGRKRCSYEADDLKMLVSWAETDVVAASSL